MNISAARCQSSRSQTLFRYRPTWTVLIGSSRLFESRIFPLISSTQGTQFLLTRAFPCPATRIMHISAAVRDYTRSAAGLVDTSGYVLRSRIY